MPLRDLEEFTVRKPIPAPAAIEGLGLTKRGRDDVNTPARGRAVLVVLALALLFTTEANLVNAGEVVLTRDQPYPVLADDVLAILGEEPSATVDTGGFLRGSRYTSVGHEAHPFLVRASGCS